MNKQSQVKGKLKRVEWLEIELSFLRKNGKQ